MRGNRIVSIPSLAEESVGLEGGGQVAVEDLERGGGDAEATAQEADPVGDVVVDQMLQCRVEWLGHEDVLSSPRCHVEHRNERAGEVSVINLLQAIHFA